MKCVQQWGLLIWVIVWGRVFAKQVLVRKYSVIYILIKLLLNHHCRLWVNETQYTAACSKLWQIGFVTRIYRYVWNYYMALDLLFYITYVSSGTLQVFGVDIILLLVKTIKHMPGDFPAQARSWCCFTETTLIAMLMRPTWAHLGTDRTQMCPMLAPWTLLSGYPARIHTCAYRVIDTSPTYILTPHTPSHFQ